MGTHSTITARMSDGTYASIYCHWDGFPSHNGKILHENYNTQEKVETLIALGNAARWHTSARFRMQAQAAPGSILRERLCNSVETKARATGRVRCRRNPTDLYLTTENKHACT